MNLIAVSQDLNELMRLERICHGVKDIVYQQGISDPAKALMSMKDVDIVLVDTNIIGGAASFASKVHDLDANINIVFMSEEKKFALDAFRVDAIDYCLKPCSKSRVLRFIQRAWKLDSLILSHFSMPDISQPITDIDQIYGQLPENIRQQSEQIAAYTSQFMRYALDADVYTDDVDLSEEVYSNIFEIVKLHNIGMTCIPPEITGATKRERLYLQKHTEYGMLILINYMDYISEDTKSLLLASGQKAKINLYYLAMSTARNHHERWDGKGYPDGLEGESIPIVARMCAICSAYYNLVSNHTLSHEAINAEMKKNAGSLFDPILINQCLPALTTF